MLRELENYLTRIRAGVSEATDLSQLPQWIERNTADPRDPTGSWSFRHHEYQPGILSDTSEDIAIQKCSQVGLSEMSVRMLLAMVSVYKALTAIYILPTAGFARKFSKQRIDPVVDNSKTLKALVDKDNDSSELKRFGNSFIYINGASGQKTAISVPAQALFQDEVDFCDPTVLTTYASRLRHASPGYQRSFSTPTVSKYGINNLFLNSTQAHYTVKCPKCHDWVAPEFMSDIVIPGFDGTLMDLDKDDLSNPSVRVDEAYVMCPMCRAKISEEILATPDLRRWVSKYPGRARSGYQVYPYDVIKFNAIKDCVNQINKYERKADWANFVGGVPFEDAESSFLEEEIKRNTVGPAVQPPGVDTNTVVCRGCCMGIDVAKTSNVLIGQRQPDGHMRVLWSERIRQGGDNELFVRLMFLARVFGVGKAVIDAGPDYTTVQMLVMKAFVGQFWACYYVNDSKSKMSNLDFNEEEHIIKAFRTGTFDSLVKQVNKGHIQFSEMAEMEIVRNHLGNFKRIERKMEDGSIFSQWICPDDKVGDHYAHALNYLMMADQMMNGGLVDKTPASVPMVGTVKLKQTPREGAEKELTTTIPGFVFRGQ